MDHDVIIQSGDNVRCLYNEILSESETYSREHNICEFCIGFCIRIIIELGRTVNSRVIVIGSVGERTVSWKNWTILILFFYVCVFNANEYNFSHSNDLESSSTNFWQHDR